MIIPCRSDWNPNAVHVPTTAPPEVWSKGFPPERSFASRTATPTTPSSGSVQVLPTPTPSFIVLTADNYDTGTAQDMDEQHVSARTQNKHKWKHVATCPDVDHLVRTPRRMVIQTRNETSRDSHSHLGNGKKQQCTKCKK